MPKPKVSILIPSYNYAHYLGEAIESALIQTYDNFELIVLDNCSTDNTEEIVRNFMARDTRILYFKNATNIGMYRNYNEALLYATGEYIKFLNADDKFEPTLLEKFVNILDNDPTISVVTSYRQYFGAKSDILKSLHKGRVEAKFAILSSLRYGNWIGEPTTVMFRRNNLNLGLFDISLLMLSDQDMWLRQLRAGDLYVIDEVLSYFRIHEEQGTFELNNDVNKQSFNTLQYTEYRRNAILNHRFGYNLYSDSKKESQIILNDFTKATGRLIKIKAPSVEPLAYLYRVFAIQYFFIPHFIYKLYEKVHSIRAILLKTLKG
jgi:glycosyltransferase involved in cell wall biosynthesis